MALRDEEEENKRASGHTPAEEVTREESREADKPTAPELPDERERRFRTPGFSRMRTDWRGPDAVIMTAVHNAVNRRIAHEFSDAYSIMHELYDVVREPVVEGDEPVVDEYGWPVWRQTPTGNFVEDWSRLTSKERERFLYQLTTRLFDWSQRAAEGWGESMMAKVIWEESFAAGYESLPPISATRPTIDDRTNRARLVSSEQRYFAVFLAYYSRKADSIVRNLELLAQRLKDVHTA